MRHQAGPGRLLATLAFVTIGALAGALPSCATPLRAMPPDALASLRLGVTTQADAEALLGAPTEDDTLPDGSRRWLYRFAPEPPVADADTDLPAPSNEHQRPDVLLLVFGPTGVLAQQEYLRSTFGVRDAAHPHEPDHEALREIPLP